MTGTEIVVRASLQDKIAYAEKLAQSGLLPAVYRRQPANVLYAAEYGEMLGLTPLAAINGLHIIEGKPTASSGMVSALVRRAGHRLRAGYDAKTRTGWCEIVRNDDPEFTYRAEWTLQRAVDANLVQIREGKPWARDKDGRPKPWERYPEAMLKARAITECARDACEEALNGVRYTPEELGAEVDEVGEPIRVTSVRADQPTGEQPAAAPAEPAVDWDAELQKAAGDREALRALWKRASEAEPDDSDLLARIMEAGAAARAAEEQRQEHVVDAEIVDDRPPAADEPPAAPRPVEGVAPGALLAKVNGQLDKLGVISPPYRLEILSRITRRDVTSSTDLSTDEAAKVADELHVILQSDTPKAALTRLVNNTEAPVTAAQLTAVAAALAEHGVTARDRLAVVGFLIGEPIATTKQLAKSEASHVLDTIAKQVKAGQFADTIRAALAASSTPDESETR